MKLAEADGDALSGVLYKNQTKKYGRKELDSFGMTKKENNKYSPSNKSILKSSERVSPSVSVKGSVTVEAALAVPIFFLAVVTLLYLFEIMAINTTVRDGLQYAGKKAATETYLTKTVLPSSIEEDVINAIGSERLSRSIVVGGSSGIHCDKSSMSIRTGIGTITAEYRIKLPILIFGNLTGKYKVRMKIKSWVGYEKELFRSDSEETVYVTETGLVYHRDYHCTHLDLSIHAVAASDLEEARNESGGRYTACRRCHPSATGQVYISNYGDSYHSNVSCSGLKRTIYSVPLSEVEGKGACSKCGQ